MQHQVKEIPGEKVEEIIQPVLFLRIRTVALSCILFLSFLWIILFCIIIYMQWDVLDHVERSLILIMLFIDMITLIMIPILLLRPFRPWLDGARVLFLLLTHGGIAVLFALRSKEFVCLPSDTIINQKYVCSMIVVCVNIFGWMIPALTILYGAGLGVLMHRLARPRAETLTVQDVEKQNRRITNNIQSPSPRSLHSLSSTHEAQRYAYTGRMQEVTMPTAY